jgi:hypothetical protein
MSLPACFAFNANDIRGEGAACVALSLQFPGLVKAGDFNDEKLNEQIITLT